MVAKKLKNMTFRCSVHGAIWANPLRSSFFGLFFSKFKFESTFTKFTERYQNDENDLVILFTAGAQNKAS